MNVLPRETLYELLGYKNRVMDPAKTKKDGTIGRYYERLTSLIKEVNQNKNKITPPAGLNLEDVNIMNIGTTGSVFKKINSILEENISKQQKLKKLKKLEPKVKKANIANIQLAKHIAKTIINLNKKGKIDPVSVLNIFQSQTSIVNGFRGLSKLDLLLLLN